jgi:phosphoglycerate dehydrogenase-like enzyme
MEIPELIDIEIIPTSMERAYALEIADQAMGYLLAFTHSLSRLIRAQAAREWRSRRPGVVLDELAGKTPLVIGWSASAAKLRARPTRSACGGWPPTRRYSSDRQQDGWRVSCRSG